MKQVTAYVLAVVLVVAFSATGSAKTPDGLTPAEEQTCSDAGYTGALWGLCNAYCEAMDCDSPAPHASEQGCARVLDNFRAESEGRIMPCLYYGGGEE